MKLTELEPRWIHPNVFVFLCPCCRKVYLVDEELTDGETSTVCRAVLDLTAERDEWQAATEDRNSTIQQLRDGNEYLTTERNTLQQLLVDREKEWQAAADQTANELRKEVERLDGLLREAWPCVWDCVYSCCPHRRPLLEKLDEFSKPSRT